MKLLFVSDTFPRDIQSSTHGVFKRMRVFLDAINGVAYSVDMLFFVDPKIAISDSYVADMEAAITQYWGISVKLFMSHRTTAGTGKLLLSRYLQKFYNLFRTSINIDLCGERQLRAFEACLERKPDVLFIHKLESMGPVLRTKRTLPPVFFDLDDIEHKAFIRSIRQPPYWKSKFLYYLEVPSLLMLERRAIKLAKKTFVCSERDRAYLTDIWRLPNVVVVPNAVNMPVMRAATAAPTLLFIGGYFYPPNAVAAEFLITEIWPLVKREITDANLIIAGASPELIKSFNRHVGGVQYTGFVEDLDELYRETRVVCCPILAGGGTRVKILEAAAYGKPIVSTHIGAEGIEFEDGREILLRDDAKSFAHACIELLREPALCDALGKAARKKVELLYHRDNVIKLIQSYISNS